MTEVGENMPNDDTTIRCPYYLRSNQTVIYCRERCGVGGCGGGGAELCAQLCECGEKKEFVRARCRQFPDMNCAYATYLNEIYGGYEYEAERKAEKGKCTTGESGEDDSGAGEGKPIPARCMREDEAGGGGEVGGSGANNELMLFLDGGVRAGGRRSGYDPDGEHEPRTGGEACIIPCGL